VGSRFRSWEVWLLVLRAAALGRFTSRTGRSDGSGVGRKRTGKMRRKKKKKKKKKGSFEGGGGNFCKKKNRDSESAIVTLERASAPHRDLGVFYLVVRTEANTRQGDFEVNKGRA